MSNDDLSRSDFATARSYLEYARDALAGDDSASQKMREALDLFIEAVMTVEFRKPKPQVIQFPHILRPMRQNPMPPYSHN